MRLTRSASMAAAFGENAIIRGRRGRPARGIVARMEPSPDEVGYRLAIEEHAGYVHARATGPRTPENARRFLKEAGEACLRAGKPSLLLEMGFSGPSLDRGAIFSVISGRAPDGLKLRRIAYLDAGAPDPGGPAFATTVASNRGVNVRLFGDVASARAWLDAVE